MLYLNLAFVWPLLWLTAAGTFSKSREWLIVPYVSAMVAIATEITRAEIFASIVLGATVLLMLRFGEDVIVRAFSR